MSADHAIAAVLLAAGAGTRFGGGKLLSPLADGVAIAAHAARSLIAAGLNVVAVVRAGDFPLGEMLEQEGCEVTYCRDAVHGMGHTLAHGIGQAPAASGWIVALADMPRVQPATIGAVVAALAAGAKIAVPVHAGERGHPVGFSRVLRSELLTLSGDTGARAVIERHREDIVRVECDDPGITFDIDRKSDLDRLA